eukprot:222673-Pyramimonas_sp.AAC.1
MKSRSEASPFLSGLNYQTSRSCLCDHSFRRQLCYHRPPPAAPARQVSWTSCDYGGNLAPLHVIRRFPATVQFLAPPHP